MGWLTAAAPNIPLLFCDFSDFQVGSEVLDAGNAPIIGHSWTRSAADVAPFPIGTPVVMFTDGHVERRNRPFDVGVAQVAAVLRRALQTRHPGWAEPTCSSKTPMGDGNRRGRRRHPRRRTRRLSKAR